MQLNLSRFVIGLDIPQLTDLWTNILAYTKDRLKFADIFVFTFCCEFDGGL